MTFAESFLAVSLWVCFAAVFYAYVGYPVVIACLARLFGRSRAVPAMRDEDLPTVSLLIAAYNEEAVIEERLLNALAVDYPPQKWEVVVSADGCSVRKSGIVLLYAV